MQPDGGDASELRGAGCQRRQQDRRCGRAAVHEHGLAIGDGGDRFRGAHEVHVARLVLAVRCVEG
jgi:hypothetical protein